VVHEVFEKEYRSGGDAAPPKPFLAFSPDGALLVFPGKNRSLCLWDIKAQKEKWSLKIGLVPSTAAFSPDGKFLAIGTHTSADHGSARIIHAETGKPERGLWFWYNGALQLAYSADGKQIFGGFRQKVFRRELTESAKVNNPGDAIIWDASKGPSADAMAFCSGGRLVALRASDELTVVDTQSGQPMLTVKGASGPIALSPDGRRLAASCQDGTTKVWDIRRCTVAADPSPEVDVRAEEGKVLIAADQIRSYDWATHTLTLAPKVREELAKRLRKDRLVSGIPFAVTVGATVVYQGSFTTIESSRSFSTPVIVVDAQAVEPKLGADQLRIQLGYPTAEFYKGEDPRADRRIREALKASDKEPRLRQQPKIDVIGAGEAAMELAKTTRDPDAKWKAIRILGNLRYERAIPLLLESLSDPHHYVRANAARALGDMKVAAAGKPLTELLQKEKNGGVIQQASLALANLGCADAIPALKSAAKHEDVQTCMWVLQAVGRLGDKRDVPFLAGYLDNASQAVQASAAQAIEQITGADFGFPKRSGPSTPDEGLRRAKAWWAEHKGEYERR
jgi:hypothetical protein